MKEIKIIDYFSINTFHEIFNTSLILMCSNIAEEIKYISGKTANENQKRLYTHYCQQRNYKKHKVLFISKHIYERKDKIGAFIRTIIGFFITLYEYLITPASKLLIYTYTNPFSLPFILLLNVFLKKKIIFSMHGELELQLQRTSMKQARGWYKLCYTLSFKYFLSHSKNSLILLLGNSIKHNLEKLYPYISDQLISINHPYFISKTNSPTKDKTNHPLKIGTIGVMKKEKGLYSLIELSQILEPEIKTNKLILQSIGKVEGINISYYPLIQWIGAEKGLPRKEFDAYINDLDYILYLYPQDSYKLTASGALMDAIKWQKPIISFPNDYFNSFLANIKIGFIHKDLNEIATYIKSAIKQPPIQNLHTNFNSVIQQISIPYNTELLNLQLKQKQFI